MPKKSVEQRMLEGLQEFSDTLKKDPESVRNKFKCNRVKLHLQPSSYEPQKVKETRDILGLSQSLFAEFLGVSVKTVQAWEQGVNRPAQGVTRLLDEIRRDPKYWCERLDELMIEA